MSEILFDEHGNPQPEGIRPIPFKDFKTAFVDDFETSETRPRIFDGYESYVYDFKTNISPSFQHWMNGSYTTNKENPNDIDLVNIVPFSDDLNLKGTALMAFITKGTSKENYMVDGYLVPVYPDDDPRAEFTKNQLAYWEDFFGSDRNGRTKTLFELKFI
ncbi:MAG: hypothetical protein ACERIH_00190 [Labilibaculum antarcticum]